MTIKTNFIQSGSYNAVDLINQFKALFKDGVAKVSADALIVTAKGTPDLSVNIAPGPCLKAGLFLNSDAIENVPITANSSGYNRIDVVIADLDNNVMSVVLGTPSSSPTVPILTGNTIALAQVLVGNNVSVINTGNITDVRIDNGNTASLATNGWFKDKKTGYIHQWGFCNASGITAVSFPIAFASVPAVILSNQGGSSTVYNTITKTSFNLSGTGLIYWTADGC